MLTRVSRMVRISHGAAQAIMFLLLEVYTVPVDLDRLVSMRRQPLG